MHRVLPCMEEGIEYEWEAPMMFNESIYAMDTIFELFLFLIGAMLGICVVVIGIILQDFVSREARFGVRLS